MPWVILEHLATSCVRGGVDGWTGTAKQSSPACSVYPTSPNCHVTPFRSAFLHESLQKLILRFVAVAARSSTAVVGLLASTGTAVEL